MKKDDAVNPTTLAIEEAFLNGLKYVMSLDEETVEKQRLAWEDKQKKAEEKRANAGKNREKKKAIEAMYKTVKAGVIDEETILANMSDEDKEYYESLKA